MIDEIAYAIAFFIGAGFMNAFTCHSAATYIGEYDDAHWFGIVLQFIINFLLWPVMIAQWLIEMDRRDPALTEKKNDDDKNSKTDDRQ